MIGALLQIVILFVSFKTIVSLFSYKVIVNTSVVSVNYKPKTSFLVCYFACQYRNNLYTLLIRTPPFPRKTKTKQNKTKQNNKNGNFVRVTGGGSNSGRARGRLLGGCISAIKPHSLLQLSVRVDY